MLTGRGRVLRGRPLQVRPACDEAVGAPSTLPVPVLYIAGEGRSGSTLLEKSLSCVRRSVSVGEVIFLFELGLTSTALCGCGELVLECEFWSEVGDRMVGGWGSRESDRLAQLFGRLRDKRNVPQLLVGRSPLAREAQSVLSRLYRVLYDVGGGSLLVDSSKNPVWASLLNGSEAIDLYVIHLVRHPSAVAYSWTTHVPRDRIGGPGDMPRDPPWFTAMRWCAVNRMVDSRLHGRAPTIILRYEDFVAHLDESVDNCLAQFSLSRTATSASSALKSRALTVSHGIAGNPSRFDTQTTPLERDDRWVEALPGWDHVIVSMLTVARRHRYGYNMSRQRPYEWSAPYVR